MDFFTTVQTDAPLRASTAGDRPLSDRPSAGSRSHPVCRISAARPLGETDTRRNWPAAMTGAEVTLVGDTGLRIQIAHMEGTRGSTIIAANTARFIHLLRSRFSSRYDAPVGQTLTHGAFSQC